MRDIQPPIDHEFSGDWQRYKADVREKRPEWFEGVDQ